MYKTMGRTSHIIILIGKLIIIHCIGSVVRSGVRHIIHAPGVGVAFISCRRGCAAADRRCFALCSPQAI